MLGPTATTVSLWYTVTKALGWDGKITLATPLWDTPKLGTLISHFGFDKWDLTGISQVSDMWSHGDIIPWKDLRIEYSLAPTKVYRYLQLPHAPRMALQDTPTIMESSPLESRLLSEYMPSKSILLTYKKLVNNTPDNMTHPREKWSHDLLSLEDEEWTEALASPREMAIHAGFRKNN